MTDVYAVSRPVTPDLGRLWCNSLVNATKLQIELTDPEQARAQDYGTESPAPSVITLNALAAAEAANSFLFYIAGLMSLEAECTYMRFRPLLRTVSFDEPRAKKACLECGRYPRVDSRAAMGHICLRGSFFRRRVADQLQTGSTYNWREIGRSRAVVNDQISQSFTEVLESRDAAFASQQFPLANIFDRDLFARGPSPCERPNVSDLINSHPVELQ